MVATSSKAGFISNLFVGTDRRLRSIVRALLYAALAFRLLSADWVLGPMLERVASALRVRGLSPGTVAFFETINLSTALLLTWIFARYEHRRVDSYGLPVREAFGARYWEGFAIGVVNAGATERGDFRAAQLPSLASGSILQGFASGRQASGLRRDLSRWGAWRGSRCSRNPLVQAPQSVVMMVFAKRCPLLGVRWHSLCGGRKVFGEGSKMQACAVQPAHPAREYAS